MAKERLEKFMRAQQERAANQAARPTQPKAEHRAVSESDREEGAGTSKRKTAAYMKDKEKNKGMGDKLSSVEEVVQAFTVPRLSSSGRPK